MSDLLGSMRTAGSSLRAFTEALDVVQSNITNASTPGYARRKVILTETTADSTGLEPRGVETQGAQTTRVQSQEEAVWTHSADLGKTDQLKGGLESMVKMLEAKGGISDSLDSLFSSFRALSAATNDSSTRQQVVSEAQNTAGAILQTASTLQTYQTNYQAQLEGTVNRVNQLVTQIAKAEKDARSTGSESLADSQVYGDLEELSSLIDFKVLHGADGSLTILGGGQVPLLQGGQTFALSVGNPQPTGANATDKAVPQLFDAFGKNVSTTLQSGEVGGLMELTNRVLPSLIGGGNIVGSLNTMARELGTQVNQALSPGNPIFTWDATEVSNTALTFTVVPGYQESDLPAGGTPLSNLATLGLDAVNVPALGGKTFQDFITLEDQKLANKATDASDRSSVSQSLLSQAQNLRSQTAGVTLEEEAVGLLQIQHSFQAVSRLIATINDLVDSVLAMKR